MSERQWERLGAAAGVVFVVALIVSGFMAPQPPHLDASSAKILRYYNDHTTAILASGMIGAFAGVFFLWFLGHMRHVMQRSEGGAEALSPVVFGSGAVLVAIATLSGIPGMTLALMANRGDVTSTPVVRMLWDMMWMANTFTFVILGVFLVAASVAMVRGEMVAPWLGWAGLVLAIESWATAGFSFFTVGYDSAVVTMQFIGFLGFAAFILVASLSMLQRPEVARETAHRPVFAGS